MSVHERRRDTACLHDSAREKSVLVRLVNKPLQKQTINIKTMEEDFSKWVALEELDDIINDVETKSSQVDDALSLLRERCHAIAQDAENEAGKVREEAKLHKKTVEDAAEKHLSDAKQEAARAIASAEKQWEEEKTRMTTTLKEDVGKQVEAMKREVANWEEEKAHIAATHNFEPVVTIHVGDSTFTTTLPTLTRYPESRLGTMFSGRHALLKDKNGAYFIDRDGTHFREILNFLRGPSDSTPESIEKRHTPGTLDELKVEADFYGLKDVMFPKTTKKPSEHNLPITATARNESTVTISQGTDQLWYLQHPQRSHTLGSL